MELRHTQNSFRLIIGGLICVFNLSPAVGAFVSDPPSFTGITENLCSRPRLGMSSKSAGDNGYRIRIEGDPKYYKAGEQYQVTVLGTRTQFYLRKFIGFMLTVEAKEKENYISPGPDVGSFGLLPDSLSRFSEDCPNAVVETSYLPKDQVQVTWTAPPSGVGCVVFRATVQENPERWYADEGNLVLEFCEEDQNTPDENPATTGCCACGRAKYELLFEGLWSRETHPKDFPTNEWLNHFSDVIGASHNLDYRMWEDQGYASEGVKDVAEKGATRKLETDLRTKLNMIHSVFKASGLWHPNVNGVTATEFTATDQFHLVSLVTMLSPSTDWILGVDSLDLCLPNCSWTPEKNVDLYLWDAGTADGVTYMSRRQQPTTPQGKIRRITSSDPNDPLSPFYDPSGAPMAPLARLTLRRQEIHEEPCGAQRNLAPNTDSNAENNNEATTDCPVSDWTEFTPCSASCGDGFRMRSRHYLDPKTAIMNSCSVSLVDKQPCQELCVGNVSCQTTEWGDWSECSVTCGKGLRTRSRKFLEYRARKICPVEVTKKEACVGMKPECENPENVNSLCAVTSWSSWSPCTVTCGEGVKIRTRLYLDPSSGSVCNTQLMDKTSCRGTKSSCTLNEAEAKQICMMPKEAGPCRGYFSRWHFDASRRICVQFIYGGCRGNMNNFEFQRDCLRTCQVFLTESSEAGNPFPLTPPPHNVGHRGDGAPVDCMVTPWTDWTPCSETCGTGQQTRSRMIKVHPEYDGTPCPENLVETRRCSDTPTCQICMMPKEVGLCRGNFPRWHFDASLRNCVQFIYGGCRGNMNNFESHRDCLRTCQVFLTGSSDETPSSTVPSPDTENQENPVDCMTTPWSEWSPCSQTCGTGRKERRRMIKVRPEKGGRPCPGKLVQRRRCSDSPFCRSADELPSSTVTSAGTENQEDSVDCMITPWSEWSPCSQSCGSGRKERRRMIKVRAENGGQPCPEKLIQRRRCSDNPVCPSSEAGNPFLLTPQDVEHRDSSPVDCMVTPWSEWTPCSTTCGIGLQARRRMVKVHPENGGSPCPENLVDRRTCTDNPTCQSAEASSIFPLTPPEFGHRDSTPVDCMVTPWSEWTSCRTASGFGLQERRRMVKLQPENGGRPCPENLFERRRCSDAPVFSSSEAVNPFPLTTRDVEHRGGSAPVDCMVTPWSDWTPCSETCGIGQQTRSRMIKLHPEYGGTPCPENLVERRRCSDTPTCAEIRTEDRIVVDCELSPWSDWAPCSKTCGDYAFMERIRTITQYPRNNGASCGPRFDKRYCRLPPCPQKS